MSLALARIPSGDVESAWHTGTAAQLPSDPEWAGEVVFVDTRSRHSNASPTDLWKAVEDSVPERWQVEEHEPGNVLRLRAQNGDPASAGWRCGSSRRGGSRYEQRTLFYPRGLLGRVFWYAGRPVQTLASRARARRVTSAAR